MNKPAFSQRGGIRKVLLVVLGTIAFLVGIYGLAGWIGAPWVVDQMLVRYTERAPGRVASVEAMHFNPFTLQANFTGIEFRDAAAQSLLFAHELDIDLSIRSLSEKRPVVNSVVIEAPEAQVRSLDQIEAAASQLRRNGYLDLRIEHLSLTNGRLATAGGDQWPLTLSAVELSLTEFDGRPEASTGPGRFTLTAMTSSGVGIETDGTLPAALDSASGELRLEGLELGMLAPRLGGMLSDTEPRGTFNLVSQYTLSPLLGRSTLELMDATVELGEIAMVPVSGFDVRIDSATARANLVLARSQQTFDAAGRIEISDARLTLADARVTPQKTFVIADTAIVVSTDPGGDGISVNVGGQLQDAGQALFMARVPAEPRTERQFSFEAVEVPAEMLSGYANQALGHRISGGQSDINLTYSINADSVDGNLSLVARNLTFLPSENETDAGINNASLDLATALLEDAEGVIHLDLPFAGSARSVRFATADALRARVAALTSTPFDELAPLTAGVSADVRIVPFLPGDTAVGDWASAAIEQLANALKERPRLGLRVHGGFDPQADRAALARQQIQMHVLLATAGPEAQARPRPVEFGEPRAQDVLDEFAGQRLSAERIGEIESRFNCEGTLVPICKRAYYASIFDALVANEEITTTQLNRLGRFRAESVADALRAQDIADDRIEIVVGAEVVESPFGVGLPVELIVAEPGA